MLSRETLLFLDSLVKQVRVSPVSPEAERIIKLSQQALEEISTALAEYEKRSTTKD